MERDYPNASVSYSNVKFGVIGSTVKFEEDGVTEKQERNIQVSDE